MLNTGFRNISNRRAKLLFSKGLVLAPFEPKRVLKAELCCFLRELPVVQWVVSIGRRRVTILDKSRRLNPVSSVCMFRTWHRVVADVPWGLILGDKIPIKECLQLGVLMSIALNAHELRKRLFLGDEKRAEVVSSKTFSAGGSPSTKTRVRKQLCREEGTKSANFTPAAYISELDKVNGCRCGWNSWYV